MALASATGPPSRGDQRPVAAGSGIQRFCRPSLPAAHPACPAASCDCRGWSARSMPRADRVLYSALLRLSRRFREERLPLLGVAGTDLVCYNLCWPVTLRRLIEAPPPGTGLAEGAQLLWKLQAQLDTLLLAEDHTRQALAEWAALADAFSGGTQCASSSAAAGSTGTSTSTSTSTSNRVSGAASTSTSSGGLGGGADNLPPLPFAAAAAAAEAGLALLTRQSQEMADPLLLDLELHQQEELASDSSSGSSSSSSAGGTSNSSGSSGTPPPVSLDALAAAVRRQHPALFAHDAAAGSGSSDGSRNSGGSGGGTGGSSSDSGGGGGSCNPALLAEQVHALSDVLYRRQRFKYEPFEWVYEGLEPLLLPPQLQRRKLAPLTLAVAAAGVGRRLGLPLLPIPAQPGGEDIAAAAAPGTTPSAAAAAAGQGLPLDQLRPDVAQRYAGRAQAAGPTTGAWLVLVGAASYAGAAAGAAGTAGTGLPAAGTAAEDAGASGSQAVQQAQQQGSNGPGWQRVMDACTGEVLDAAAAQRRHPTLDLKADWQLRGPLVAWQHMVRTIIQAHQRRGESDLVAHWVYVLLALDPLAPEWHHMLQGSELQQQ